MAGVRPKVYLGIDPGFADAGYGVIAVVEGKEKCIAYGSIQTPAGEDSALRLRSVHEELSALLKKFKPDCVAVERLYFAKNAKTALSVAEARGVIRMTIAAFDIPCREFNPADVKIAVCGHGTAPKKQVQRMVASLLDLNEMPKPDDAADALALAIALANSEKFSTAVERSEK